MDDLYMNTAFNNKEQEKDNQAEKTDDELELYETIEVDNEILGNTCVAAIGLDISNAGLSEDYEVFQTAQKEENKTDVSKTAICTTDTKQKVMLLILLMASLLMSSASLVIAFTSPWRSEPIDGSWTGWESWMACSTTCDVGLQTRHRNCSRQCLGEAKEQRLCMSAPCSPKSDDGSWSGWASWEACSNTCDVGLQKRHRNCLSVAPLGQGRQCLGEDSEQRLCMPGPCSDGGWSFWGSWGSCTASCDIGLKSRIRTCTYPRPSFFGSFCEGPNTQSDICEGEPCKDGAGGWSAWGSWGSCSSTCDIGLKSRLRTCTHPRPSLFGSFCEGANSQSEICEGESCKDGGWSVWGSWGSCSASCDIGLKSRLRTCNHSRPSLFGSFCEGANTQSEICEGEPCKDGGWSIWGSWGSCSTSCDIGLKSRLRTCTHPRPSLFGSFCEGANTQSEICEGEPCKDGVWSVWGSWGSCSASCDIGLRSRLRTCTHSRSSALSSFCEGASTNSELCEGVPCKGGGWSVWGNWGSCSTSCDIGLKSRLRTCNQPKPSLLGSFCEGTNMQSDICEGEPCKNGGWSVWGSWGSCTASCDIGLKSRSRTCSHPKPSPFGNFCEGADSQSVICEDEPCKETRVAFKVYQSSANYLTSEHTVIFTRVLLNEGEAYNTIDGIFTAPISGLYQFNGQVCTTVGEEADYTLKIERKSFSSGEHMTPSGAKDGKCTSFSAVASVLKGEKVWITSHHLYANDNDWNSFSGILIHEN